MMRLAPWFTVGTVFLSLTSPYKSNVPVHKQLKFKLIRPKNRLPKLIAMLQMFKGKLQSGIDVPEFLIILTITVCKRVCCVCVCLVRHQVSDSLNLRWLTWWTFLCCSFHQQEATNYR